MSSDLESLPGHTVQVTDWQRHGVQKCIAASSRNFVGLMEDGRTVLKYPQCKTPSAMESLHEEAARYSHLGSHDNLVVFKAIHKDGLLFEYCERGQLHDAILGPFTLTDNQKRAIGKQITLCLSHLHERNFIHCDLNVNNVFITAGMDAKVGDIQGQLSAPDRTIEMPTMSQENAKSRHPQAGDDEFSPRTDIFALGTLLYHMWHGHSPFPDLDEYTQQEVIQAQYRRGEYPIDVSRATGMDGIIRKCWTSKYKHANEVLRDMDNLDEEKSE